jgi:hypothetical protein
VKNWIFGLLLLVVGVGLGAAVTAIAASGDNQAHRLDTIAWDGPEASHGTFSSRSTSTSTSYSVTVTGAAIGDSCDVVFGIAVAAANQALEENCKITAADTATVRITNASGGSITPTTGRRGVHVVGITNPG